MKIGVFTDLHLGKRQYGLQERENDFYSQYIYAVDCFVNENVDMVICAGDVFDMPRPSPRALSRFYNGIKILSDNNIPFVNIIGNHSMIQSPNFLTPDELIKDYTGNSYILLDMDKDIITDDVYIAGLPFHFNYEYDMLKNRIEILNEKAQESAKKTKILVLHQAFKEFCGFSGETLSIEDIDVSNFDLIICGHIHERKLIEINNGKSVFLQPGSLERSSIAEASDEENQGKGIFIIDTDNININSVAENFAWLHSPRKFFISDMYMNEAEDIEKIKNEILNAVEGCKVPPILFLKVHDKSGSFQQVIDMTKDLRSSFLTVNFNYFDENIEIENHIVTDPNDIPTPREALKITLNPMDENERALGLDLYDFLKDGKDVTKILNDFFDKWKTDYESVYHKKNYTDQDLEELELFFDKL